MQPTSPESAAASDAQNVSGLRRLLLTAKQLHEREKSRLRDEIAQVPGLMALLMKPRNGQRWTPHERAELRMQLRGLSHISIYIATAVLPGTALTLPLIAWWIDRRRRKRE